MRIQSAPARGSVLWGTLPSRRSNKGAVTFNMVHVSINQPNVTLWNIFTLTAWTCPWCRVGSLQRMGKRKVNVYNKQWLWFAKIIEMFFFCDAAVCWRNLTRINGSTAIIWNLSCFCIEDLQQRDFALTLEHRSCLQPSVVITRSNLSRYYIRHCDDRKMI